mmetsp:Transcript_13078/g.51978  ORF Transcript_13078/g.51978 Transcript_13078/m.51978 type:complete len:106 (-) Transcript_13078:4330-4647(-)
MMLPKRGGVDIAPRTSRFEQGMPSQSTESMSGLVQKSSWMRSFNGTNIFDNLQRAKYMFTTDLREETGPKSKSSGLKMISSAMFSSDIFFSWAIRFDTKENGVWS